MTLFKDKNIENTLGRSVVFFSIFFVLFQIFISFPIATWKRNKFNFEAPLTYSYSVLGITAIGISLLSIIIAFLLPKTARRVFSVFFLILGVTIMVQQNFLNWDYGILDGQALNFDRNFGLGFLDITLWGGALCVLVFFKELVIKQSVNILIAIGCITGAMSLINVISYGDVATPYTVDERDKFNFSKNKNIIVFLFDAYQIDLLKDIAQAEPDLVLPLDGFTFYENSAAVFAKTYPTIPLFLTGRRYKKEQPLLDFFKIAYDDSLMEKMQSNDWDIGLYPNLIHYPSLINAIDIKPSIMDNVIGGVPSKAKIETYLQALDLSLFRAVPHILKPAVFNNGNFIARRDSLKGLYVSAIGETNVSQPFIYKTKQKHKAVGFKDLLNEHGQAVTENSVFRFYHFMVPHAPNRLDRNLNFVKHDPSFEAYREYSIAGLTLMGAYLDKLKEIGAYNNATILILSDHGMGTINKRQYDEHLKSYVDINEYGIQRSAAKSIFLVKKPGDTGLLKTSIKPVSGIDVAPTIAAAAGINIGQVEGKDVDEINDTDIRARLFNYYTFSTWDSKYLDDFEAFQIKGHVKDDASWTRLGMVKSDVKIKNNQTYKWGEVMSFGADVKTDSNFLNAFIGADKYVMNPNFINAKDGALDLEINLKSPPGREDILLLQFEIYSGDAVERKLIINGHEKKALLKPKRRKLNRGFLITPDLHEGRKQFNLSFRSISDDMEKPLHLSSVKLTPIQVDENTKIEDYLKFEN